MKKYLFALFFLLNLSVALAAVDVHYHGVSNNGPVNEFSAYAYDCLDNSCTQYRDFSGTVFDTTTTNGTLTIRYPDSLATPFGYAVFYVDENEQYRPMEFRPVIHSSGNPGIFNVDFDIEFSKVSHCRSLIHDFVVVNEAKPNIPLVMQVAAKLDAETVSAFRKVDNNIAFVPGFLNDWYSAETEVHLTIRTEAGAVVHQETASLNLFADTAERVEFGWTPRDNGRYVASVMTEVTDDACAVTTPEQSEKYFVVLEEEPDNACYTLLNNLALDDAFPESGQIVGTTFSKISNYADSFGGLNPVATLVQILVEGPTGDLVYSDLVTLGANPNDVDPVQFGFNWQAQNSGLHTVTIAGIADDDNCDFVDNHWEVVTTNVFVEDPSNPGGGGPNDPPENFAFDVTFIVTDSLDGELVEDARVLLSNGRAAETGADGEVTFSDVVNGVYSFSVKHDDYETAKGSFVVDGADLTVTVELDLDTDNDDRNREEVRVEVGSIRIPNAYSVQAGDLVEVAVNFENDGNVDLDDARAAAMFVEFGTQDRVGPFDLDPGDSLSRRLFVPVPEYAPSGTYHLRITVGEGKHTRVIYRPIKVNGE